MSPEDIPSTIDDCPVTRNLFTLVSRQNQGAIIAGIEILAFFLVPHVDPCFMGQPSDILFEETPQREKSGFQLLTGKSIQEIRLIFATIDPLLQENLVRFFPFNSCIMTRCKGIMHLTRCF